MTINIPALDRLIPVLNRLMDYLEGKKQAQLDAEVARLVASTQVLRQHNNLLEKSIGTVQH